jgi:soluble lytic murein transglycosylase-like protein
MRRQFPLLLRALARPLARGTTRRSCSDQARPGSDDPGGPTARVSRRRVGSLLVVMVSLGLLTGAGAAGFSVAHSYVVQPGDSLWAISRANGLTVSQLAAANQMNENDLLLIGRHLTIPSDAPQAATTSSGSAATSSSAPSASASGPSTANPWTFCSTFVAQGGPWGVMPELLQQSPDRLALQPLFMQWASHYGLSLPLLEAIAWQESGWQQAAVSSAGAVGTGQLMPGTASFISSTLVGAPLNINSVSDNIRMSAAFLSYLAGVEGNNRCATIAAYYEGPDNLRQYGVFPETEAYVASVEALIPRFE